MTDPAPERARKRMFVLWGAGLDERLRDGALHARLAERGASRLQVNVDDERVGGQALRITTFEEPVAAVVSVWTPAGPPDDGVAGLVAGVADRVAGWDVEERRPLEPPRVPDGERAEALANVALLRRPAELSREEWLHRWLVDHTPVAIRTQATSGYVQNVVLRAATPDAPRVDALVEELFPPAAAGDLHAFYGSGGDDAELQRRLAEMLASVARFGADRDLDVVATGRYRYELARG
ncbi:EthD domain-containing protein [Nocardioides ferulae]|uniref:EthD domain-containing protein n=1 Tax=Nocardioides ferulae TaxID=2340821 RepID=UPI000EB1DFFE|nr:EthD domain-containing protein [Nocardioides ferulae]